MMSRCGYFYRVCRKQELKRNYFVLRQPPEITTVSDIAVPLRIG